MVFSDFSVFIFLAIVTLLLTPSGMMSYSQCWLKNKPSVQWTRQTKFIKL